MSFGFKNAVNEKSESTAASELSTAYKQALLSPFEKAGSEITDPEIAEFTTKLVNSYDLEQSTTEVSDNDLASLLPDIKKIQKTAMDLPLKEAGKQLKDKELSDFYNSFIQSIGVE